MAWELKHIPQAKPFLVNSSKASGYMANYQQRQVRKCKRNCPNDAIFLCAL
jgi:hypothetical protein